MFWFSGEKELLLGSRTAALLPCPGFLWLEPGREAEPGKTLILSRTPVKGTECPSPFAF